MSALTLNIIEAALDNTKKNGGSTHWFDGVRRTFGVVVGNGRYGIKLLFETAQPHYLLHVAQRWEELGADGVGFWFNEDDGYLYVDPVFFFMPCERQAAYAQAIIWGELAVYDLAAKKVIETTEFVSND